jgi:hypothetical protein
MRKCDFQDEQLLDTTHTIAVTERRTSYNAPIVDNSGKHIDPTQNVRGGNDYTKQSHELRLQSPADQRLRLIAGAFYQKQ